MKIQCENNCEERIVSLMQLHARTHTRTHARTQANTHAHTYFFYTCMQVPVSTYINAPCLVFILVFGDFAFSVATDTLSFLRVLVFLSPVFEYVS